MLPAINRMVCAGATDGMFVTMLMVVHDPKTQSFEYFNAGHPGWVITESDGRQLRTHQIPLGFSIDTDYSASDRLVLEPGDILLMPTDGIQETPGEEGLFGTVRMLEIVRQRREDAAHLIVEGLIDAAIRFSGSQKPNDDMTAIVIKAL
jgi:phosphoserine phosphatase RsbU/P